MQKANKLYIVIGLITAGLGTVPFLAALGILPTRAPRLDDAPNWIAFAIGLMFVLAGIMVIVRGFIGVDDSSSELPQTTSRGLRGFYDLLRLPIPILLALTFSWVAFGPGERHFSTSFGFGGVGVATAGGSQMFGRVMFGICAVLGWIIVLLMVRTFARRWFLGREP